MSDPWNFRINLVAILGCLYGIAIVALDPHIHSAFLGGLINGALSTPLLASIVWAAR